MEFSESSNVYYGTLFHFKNGIVDPNESENNIERN